MKIALVFVSIFFASFFLEKTVSASQETIIDSERDGEGNVVSEILWKKGSYYTVKTYYPNGQLKGLLRYTESEPDKIPTMYNENGTPVAGVRIEDGQFTGEVEYVSEDGQYKSLAQYKKGLLHGERKEWYDDMENVDTISTYEDGFFKGMKTFDNRGNQTSREVAPGVTVIDKM